MAKKFYDYYLPVRPNLEQLETRRKICCARFVRGDPRRDR